MLIQHFLSHKTHIQYTATVCAVLRMEGGKGGKLLALIGDEVSDTLSIRRKID